MRPKLYMSEICPSTRAVILTAKYLGLTLQVTEVDCNDKFNRQYSIPTLEDSGYVVWDSHAIIAYLVGKYGQDDSLYPRDDWKRSLIDQRLRFDCGVMSFFTKTVLNSAQYEDNNTIDEIYEVVENFFEGNSTWIAGDELTIADLSLLPSITSLDVVVPINEKKFPKVTRWIKNFKSMPLYEANMKGLCKLRNKLNRC